MFKSISQKSFALAERHFALVLTTSVRLAIIGVAVASQGCDLGSRVHHAKYPGLLFEYADKRCVSVHVAPTELGDENRGALELRSNGQALGLLTNVDEKQFAELPDTELRRGKPNSKEEVGYRNGLSLFVFQSGTLISAVLKSDSGWAIHDRRTNKTIEFPADHDDVVEILGEPEEWISHKATGP